MIKTNNVLVTTTSTLEGWEIQSYLGPVTSHVVAGTGVLWDSFAKLSDFFGGRSGKYQDQLASINDEAIRLVKERALIMGGNVIVGFGLDQNQISGKDKQMLMVTALGTAVKAVRVDGNSDGIYVEEQILNVDELRGLLKKKAIVAAANNSIKKFDDKTWDLVINGQLEEFAPAVIQEVEEKDHYRFDRGESFFLNLPDDVAKKHLYGALLEERKVYEFVKHVIEVGELLDLGYVERLLDSNNISVQKQALSLMACHKPTYTREDIDDISRLLTKVDSLFPVRVEYVEEKQVFSGAKRKWICDCKTKNFEEVVFCGVCGKNIRGLNPTQMGAIDQLNKRAEVLKEVFETV